MNTTFSVSSAFVLFDFLDFLLLEGSSDSRLLLVLVCDEELMADLKMMMMIIRNINNRGVYFTQN